MSSECLARFSAVPAARATAVPERRTERTHPRPANSDSIFVDVIVKAPILQLISIVLGFLLIAIDYPAPFLKGSIVHRSFPIRIVFLLLQTFVSILFYQVRVCERLAGVVLTGYD